MEVPWGWGPGTTEVAHMDQLVRAFTSHNLSHPQSEAGMMRGTGAAPSVGIRDELKLVRGGPAWQGP